MRLFPGGGWFPPWPFQMACTGWSSHPIRTQEAPTLPLGTLTDQITVECRAVIHRVELALRFLTAQEVRNATNQER
jgi:hypothetical protein